MSLGSFYTVKDSANPGVPIALIAFTFQDGSQGLYCTHPLNSTEGGVAFPGTSLMPAGNYLARVSSQDLSAIQQRSPEGVDRMARITLHLSNADQFIWSNHEQAPAPGFRGARVVVAICMWQVGTSNFTTDSPTPFTGTCDMAFPEQGATVITVSATNNHNAATVKLPIFPIQPRCPHVFPVTAAQRQAAATDPSSQWYGCGYAPDATGTDPEDGGSAARGNYQSGTTPFADCNYTRSDCMQRMGNPAGTSVAPDGDIQHDTTGRSTATFAGVQWNPPVYYRYSKSYTQGKSLASFAYLNESIYGSYVPMLYGQQWVDVQAVNVVEDGNSTRFECVVTNGYVGSSSVYPGANGAILKVVFNGEEIPFQGSDPLYSWYWVTAGGKHGACNTLPGYSDSSRGYSALGDCYGSMAVIVIVVYRDLYDAQNGAPTVRVLAGGPKIRVFTSPTSSSLVSSSSPPWVLLDVLNRANWNYSEIDIQTFINAATFCNQSISYVNSSGATASHARFIAEFCLTSQVTAAEVIAGLLRSFNAYTTMSDAGLLQLFINQTLADSQPSPVTGSNYNTAISSVHASGSAGNGYVAYLLDESSVCEVQNGDEITFDIQGQGVPNVNTPNQISIQFQDRDNQYQTDSISQVDSGSVSRSGGVTGGGQPGGALTPEVLQQRGISSFDQAIRVINTYIAERQYGNEDDDARGTRVFTIGTTVKAAHLRTGHIIRFSWQQLGISNQLFRVIGKAPSTNYETIKLVIQWMNDVWYTDAYGQSPQQFQNQLIGANHSPRPWQPYSEAPISNLFGPTNYNFSLAQGYVTQADGSALAELIISGCPPVNKTSSVRAPLTAVQGNTASTGGSLAGGRTYMIVLCGIDANGLLTPPSKAITVAVPSGTNTNTISTGNIFWDPGTVGYVLFFGEDVYHCTFQSSDATHTPSSITITAKTNFYAYAPPDAAFSKFLVQVKQTIHAGIIGINVAAVATNQITLGGATLTNNLAGYTASIIGTANSTDPQKILDFSIVSNSGNVLTLATDPSSYVGVGDALVVRALGSIITSNTIGDANFLNAITNGGLGMIPNAEVGNLVRIWAGPGIGQIRRIVSNTDHVLTLDVPWDPNAMPTSASCWTVEEPTWKFANRTSRIVASDPAPATPPAIMGINVANYLNQQLLCQVVTEDATGNLGTSFLAPVREIWIFGSQGNIPSPSNPIIYASVP